MTPAQRYADFAVGLDWAHLPQPVREVALELCGDWLANAAAGHGSPLAQALSSIAPAAREGNEALTVADLAPADPLWAAAINAAAAHAGEFDDSFRAGLYHPGAPIQSAAFAAACRARASGATFLAGVVAGYEVSLRLASAVNPAHYKTWHTTGTIGTLGAAVASARVLGLAPAATVAALGLAGTQAAGLWEVLPDAPEAKNLHPAKAAQSGLLAALLASRGIPGPATILEGPRGLFAAMVPAPVDATQCIAGLGDEWLTPATTFKAYPVCGHAMTPIEASLQLHPQLDVAAIEAIEVRAHPVSIQIASEPFPKSEAQAKFSIPYCVAIALIHGRVSQHEFSPELLADATVRRLLDRITLIPDASLARVEGQRPARVTLRLKDGTMLVASAEVRKGDPERPMTATEKRDKCIGLAAPAWGVPGAERIFAALTTLPSAANVLEWATDLRPLLRH